MFHLFFVMFRLGPNLLHILNFKCNFDSLCPLFTGRVQAQNIGEFTWTMKGEELARTAEMSVEAAYRTREAAPNLAGGDILRRLTRIRRHRR